MLDCARQSFMCATEGWETYGQWSIPEFKWKKEMGVEMSLIRDHTAGNAIRQC